MIKDTAKTIVCYGDSNTWGARAGTDGRLSRSVRWTSLLQNTLGESYEVISEGLPGRTFVALNPDKPHRCGITHLHAILESHDPFQYLIIMLGTNDVNARYNLTPEQIAGHLEETILLTQNEKVDIARPSKILVVCPPPIIQPIGNDLDESMVDGPEKFKKLPELFKKVAEKHGCDFMNAGDHLSNGTTDGYHLEEDGHKKLAELLASWIQKQ